MADSSIPADPNRFLDAVRQEIERRLSQDGQLKWSAMDPAAIRQAISKKASAGWKILLGPDYLGKDRTLFLYLPVTFPYDPPAAHVAPAAYQEWPHAEPSGRLCLWRSDDRPGISDAKALSEDYFARIGQLIELVLPGSDAERRRQEFQDEWLSYWLPADSRKVAALNNYLITAPPLAITPLFHQTLIRAGTDRNNKGHIRTPGGFWRPITVLADDPEEIKCWGADLIAVSKLSEEASGLYIPLRRITSPGMPQSLPALRAWLLDCGGSEATAAFDQAITEMQVNYHRMLLLLGLATSDGVAVNGLTVEIRAPSTGPPRGYSPHQRQRRKQIVTHPTWVIRGLAMARADREWMRDRGVDPGGAVLAKKHVILVGCGMLGSPIAEGLARAGVSQLTLIDPENLDPANIGRHILGASYAGQGKAKGLAHHIRSNIPSGNVTPIGEDVVTQTSCDIFGQGVDLVICAASDWRCEQFLMSERTKRGAPVPMLVCWLEPYAVAGHALLSMSASDHLSKLFAPDGRFLKPCFEWPGRIPTYRLPACQASFQPAGMAAALPVIAMCTTLALDCLLQRRKGSSHALWFSSSATAESVGGKLAQPMQNIPEYAWSERELFA